METILFFDSHSSQITGTSQNFQASFNPPLLLDEKKTYEIALINSTIWYSWFNINTTNNQIRIFDGKAWKTLVIPRGAYNLTDINRYIQRKIENEDGITIEPNFNTLHSEIYLKHGYKVDFDIPSSLAPVLGFSKKLVDTTSTSDFIVNITDTHNILIHCSLVSEAYLNGRTGDVIYSFSPDKPPGFQLNIQPNEKTFLPLTKTDRISDVIMRITDQDGKELNLNNERTTFSLHLRERK